MCMRIAKTYPPGNKHGNGNGQSLSSHDVPAWEASFAISSTCKKGSCTFDAKMPSRHCAVPAGNTFRKHLNDL